MKSCHANIIDNTTYEVIKRVLLIQIPIRELHNDLMEYPLEGGFDGVRLESGEVIIGDTSLRKYMPDQVKK